MVKVVFHYDENVCKWEPIVEGVDTALEAVQAFSAVVLSCQLLELRLLPLARVLYSDEKYIVTPCVR